MSYVVMKSKRVAKMAQECIDRILERRKNEWLQRAEEIREEEEKSWFRKLFKTPPRSVEQILEDIQTPSRREINWLSVYIENYGSENVRIARRLLKAAAVADEINVSADDLSAIT